MQDRIRGLWDKVLAKWNELNRTQKFQLISTVVAVLITLGITVFLVTRPRMVVIMPNLDYQQASQVKTALDDAGIYNTFERNGTSVAVRERDAVQAEIILATANVPSAGRGVSSFTYETAMANSGMGTTESIKAENLKRLKEGDLSRNLSQFSYVNSATVTLSLPSQTDYFQKTKQGASASAVVDLNTDVDKAQAQAMARYLSRSVDNLDMKDIEIVDQNGHTVYSGMEQQSGGSGSDYDLELQRKHEIENKIRSTLLPLYNDVNPQVNLVLNWDENSQNSVTYTSPVADSPTGLVAKDTTEKQTVTNGQADGEPGVAPNSATSPTYQTGSQANSSATVNNRTTDYLHNVTESSTKASTGNIVQASSSVAVTVYKYKEYNEATVSPAVLNGMSWADFKASLQPAKIAIDPDLLIAVATGTGIDKVSIIGYEVPVFVDKAAEPVQVQSIILFGLLALLILLLAIGLIKKTQPDEVTEIEPELSVEDLLVSTQLEEQKAAAQAEALQEINFSKESETKRQIEKFVSEKPEAVAQLLRNWLNDDWE